MNENMRNSRKKSIQTFAKAEKPKLQDLKKQVYRLANVNSTKALKGHKSVFAKWDFRLRVSWADALVLLQGDIDEWCANPPDEYRELFSEISKVSKEHQDNIRESIKLCERIEKTTKELDEFAEDKSKEANTLMQQAKASKQQEEISRLN